jgi:hypothetical protein
MRLDAHGIGYRGIIGHVLPSLMPHLGLCCQHKTGAQSVTAALCLHVPSFHGGDRGCHAPFRVVAETDLDTPAASPPVLSTTKVAPRCGVAQGIDVVSMLLCCASPQGEPHTEPLGMIYGCHGADNHGCPPLSPCLTQGRVTGGSGPGCLGRGSYRFPSSRTTDSGSGQSPCSPNHASAWG